MLCRPTRWRNRSSERQSPGGAVCSACSARNSVRINKHNMPMKKILLLTLAISATALLSASAGDAKENYDKGCAKCHGKEGKGNGYMSAQTKRDGQPLPPTNLASQMVQANTDGELFWKITNGRSPMPAHRVRFEDEQRWYIVAYLRTLKP